MLDFVNYREHTDSAASIGYSASWSQYIPSLFIGTLLGVAACLVGLKVAQTKADQAVFIEAPIILDVVAEKPLEFDLYGTAFKSIK